MAYVKRGKYEISIQDYGCPLSSRFSVCDREVVRPRPRARCCNQNDVTIYVTVFIVRLSRWFATAYT